MTTSNDKTHSANRREALASRLWRAAELQAAEIENRIAAGPRPSVEAIRDAKTLSVLARTLRELSAADGALSAEMEDDGDDNAPPDDIEDLRQQIGDKLQALAAARSDGGGDARRG